MLKIKQHVKIKISNANTVITENQLKHCFRKKVKEDDTKKTKKFTEIQVLTEDFTPYKIR